MSVNCKISDFDRVRLLPVKPIMLKGASPEEKENFTKNLEKKKQDNELMSLQNFKDKNIKPDWKMNKYEKARRPLVKRFNNFY
jgi:hypothetical protein